MTGTRLQREPFLMPYCEEKQRLVGEFLTANLVLMDLHTLQTDSIIRNEPDFSRFDDLIHLAREKKDHAKYALIAHMETHHCKGEPFYAAYGGRAGAD
jgi:hypothetical protein